MRSSVCLTILPIVLIFSCAPLATSVVHNLRIWITLDAQAHRILGSNEETSRREVQRHMTRVNSALTEANLTLQITGLTIQDKEVDKEKITTFEKYFVKEAGRLPDNSIRYDMHQLWTGIRFPDNHRYRSQFNKSCGIQAYSLVSLTGLFDHGPALNNDHVLQYFILKSLVENVGWDNKAIDCRCGTSCNGADPMWMSMTISLPTCVASFVARKFFPGKPLDVCPDVKDNAETVVPVCGNGILEKNWLPGVPVEECDCMFDDKECNNCCIASQCRLDDTCNQPPAVKLLPATGIQTTTRMQETTRLTQMTTVTDRQDSTTSTQLPSPAHKVGTRVRILPNVYRPKHATTTPAGERRGSFYTKSFGLQELVTKRVTEPELETVTASTQLTSVPTTVAPYEKSTEGEELLPATEQGFRISRDEMITHPSPPAPLPSSHPPLLTYGTISFGVGACLLLIVTTNLMTCLITRRKRDRQRCICPDARSCDNYL